MKRVASHRLFAALTLAAAALVAGCATQTTPQGMTPTAQAGASTTLAAKLKPQPYSVAVSVAAIAPSAGAGASLIRSADLKAAIEAAIRDSKAFREVVGSGGPADYELAVTLNQVSAPAFGFSMTVGIDMGWTLTRTSDHRVVFRRGVESTHTAAASEAFAGRERLRIAIEGAVRNNIAQGVPALTEASL